MDADAYARGMEGGSSSGEMAVARRRASMGAVPRVAPRKADTTVIKAPLRPAVPLVLAAATTAAVALTATATPSAAVDRPAGTSVPARAGITGWARMDYPVPQDDVRIFVDAHGLLTPHGDGVLTRPYGSFRIQHLMPQEDATPPLFNWGDFKVDCVRIDGPDVAVTGRIVHAGPYWQEFLHRTPPARMGVSFHVPAEGGHATRIGITPPAKDGQSELPKCAAKDPDWGITDGAYHITARHD